MQLLPVVRGFHIGATLLLAGGSAFELLILRRSNWTACSGAVAPIRRWLRLLGTVGLLVALLTWFAWLAALAINMSGLPVSQALTADVLWTVIARTTFGHVWAIRLGLLAFFSVQLTLSRAAAAPGPYFELLVNAAASMGLVCSLAWTGHALGTHAAHLVVDAIHLIAAAIWIGMIPPLWFIVRRAPASREWAQLAIAAADNFFWPGVLAVAVLAFSGVANATWLIDSISDLFTTRYGVLLMTKVGLFLLMVALAMVNRSLTRRMRTLDFGHAPATLRSLGRTMTFELAFGVAVIAVVAVLGVTPPAAHEHLMHHMNGSH